MNVPKLRFKEFDGEWEVVTLGEISKLSSSKRIHLSDYVNKGIPFYRGSEISKGGVTGNQELFISRELYEKIKAKYGVPKFNDLLVSAVGTLGNLWKVDEREFYYKDGNLILISDLKADTDYIFSYFSDVFGKNRLIDSAAGSNQKALTMVKMRSVKVPLPSEKEQKKIGEFFGIMDKKIQLQQQKINLLQEQKKGYMQKMFPKAGETQPEMRFDGFTGEWEECKLREVANHRGGTAIEKYFDDNGDYKVISIGSYGLDNKYVDQNIRAISNDITDSRLVKKGELTMVLNDKTSNGTIIGRSLLIEKDNEFVVNQRTEIISPKTAFDSAFAYVTLNGPFREKVRKIVQGGTQIYVNYSAVENLNLLVPQIEEQKKIGSFFKQLDNVITFQQQKLELFQKQKQGFMQQMFI